MSFILDALRKSEHERQRQTGPALAEVAVAPPKPRSNVWATVAIALLLVNLVAIGVYMIRKANQSPAAQSTPAAAAPAPAPAPAVQDQAPAQVSMTRTLPSPAPSPSATPPMLQPAQAGAAAENDAGNPLADEVSGAGAPDPQLSAHASAPPPGPPAVTRGPSGRGSVVYEQLPDSSTVGGPDYGAPRSAAPQAAAPAVVQAPPAAAPATQRLPGADELAASGGVPALNLDLHVYSTKPNERMVFINSHRYREGDTLAEGPVVRQITPDGVVLEFRGNQFLLGRD